MSRQFSVDFIWIPESLGGHGSGPYSGMRLQIRWQEHIDAYLQNARDVDCRLENFDQATSLGSAVCSLASQDPVPLEWLEDGVLIELLNGFRVLAIGRIRRRVDQRE